MIWLLLVALLALPACTKQKAPAEGPTDNPPADGGGITPPSTTLPPSDVSPQVLDRLKKGTVSPDKKWLATSIAAGAEADQGVWIGSTDLNVIKRVSPEVQAYAGLPQWTPWNTVLYAVENGLNVDVTWFEADPADGSVSEYLPALLKGKRALIQRDAFSADGKQIVYSTGNCLCKEPPASERVEVWLANTDGSGVKKLGENILAGFPGGELTTAEPGK